MTNLPEDLPDEPTALAYTPDEEIERGVARFKELWPDKWQAWLDWLKKEDAGE